MEYTMKCNILTCRVELHEQALVTSCLHAFCLECAQRLNLLSPGIDDHRQCPACFGPLPGPESIAVNNIRPNDDVKAVLMRGLSPSMVLDCAAAALSFWEYQMASDLLFETSMKKSSMEKHSRLQADVEKFCHEVEAERRADQDRLEEMTMERDKLKQKYDELIRSNKEKHRRLLQTQELYDKLKREVMVGQMQDAATEAVDSSFRPLGAGAEPSPNRPFGAPAPHHQEAEPAHAGLDTRFRRNPTGSGSHQPFTRAPQYARADQDASNGPIRQDQFRSVEMPSVPTPRPAPRRRGPGAETIGLPGVPGLVVGDPPLPAHGRPSDFGNRQPHRSSNASVIGIGTPSLAFGALHPHSINAASGGINGSQSHPRLTQRPTMPPNTYQNRGASHWRPN